MSIAFFICANKFVVPKEPLAVVKVSRFGQVLRYNHGLFCPPPSYWHVT